MIVLNKNLLFIINTIELGGVETYALRLAKEYLFQHHEKMSVLVLSRRSNSAYLLQQFLLYANVIYLDELTFIRTDFQLPPRINSLIPFNASAVKKRLGDVGHVHAIDEITLVVAMRLHRILSAIAVSVGVYHSKLFTWGGEPTSYSLRFPRYLFSTWLPKENILFFNYASRKEVEGYFSTDFERSPVFPLGVIESGEKKITAHAKFGKLVSIGRLVDFKTYNENVIRALPHIRTVIPQIEYHIYGDGPERKNLEKLADSLNLADIVHFHGNIEYSDFSSVLEDCWCFVGSGTAIVEAASLGMVSIVGTESSKTSSGFFHNISGFDYNESSSDHEYEYHELIFELLNYDLAVLSEASKNKSKIFSLSNNVNVFYNVRNEIEQPKFSFLMYVFSSFFTSLYNKINRKGGSRLG
ncbi:glycosyltransferase [Aeromonas caviae]|uniref:glycosyltransferase n=1 Tax=Aeromonas TaxID=642 RepID=UPI0022E23262|nr:MULTISPECIES: glycosyltransferase [Aeromonas]MEB5775833.1 glycosyltransferase [Aeromonas caviae]MEB6651059.1 glycosyltransferase [Aeromonas caviae]